MLKSVKEELSVRDKLYHAYKKQGKPEAWLKSWLRGWVSAGRVIRTT